MRGERVQIPLKAGHHRPASETSFKWRADNGPTLNAGLVALRFFKGWGFRTPCHHPSEFAHEELVVV